MQERNSVFLCYLQHLTGTKSSHGGRMQSGMRNPKGPSNGGIVVAFCASGNCCWHGRSRSGIGKGYALVRACRHRFPVQSVVYSVRGHLWPRHCSPQDWRIICQICLVASGFIRSDGRTSILRCNATPGSNMAETEIGAAPCTIPPNTNGFMANSRLLTECPPVPFDNPMTPTTGKPASTRKRAFRFSLAHTTSSNSAARAACLHSESANADCDNL